MSSSSQADVHFTHEIVNEISKLVLARQIAGVIHLDQIFRFADKQN